MSTTTIATEHLEALGFSESEARAYASLVQSGPMTGYQLAKASGVPRPNVYGVIDRLEKRGAVTRIGVGDGVKYAALPAREMLARLSSGIDGHLHGAQEALARLGGAGEHEYVWNLVGYDNVLDRAERMVRDAQQRLLIGVWSEESARLAEAVSRAQARGVEIATLCVQGCATECGGCRGDVYRYAVTGTSATRWLMVIADDRELVVGEISPEGEAQAAHTALPVIVAIAANYLRNTIAAAEIVRSLGPKLPKLLDRDAVRAIEGAGLAAGSQSWFKQLMSTVRKARG
jgi:sugar-specific transcriptional regulator TrmB